MTLPDDARVRINHGKEDFGVSMLGSPPLPVEIVRLPLHDDARRLGEALAEWLPAPLEDEPVAALAPAGKQGKGRRRR